MLPSSFQTEWPKLATAQTLSNDEVESSFVQQAYMFIQNKAAPLMRAPFRVGFEIVHRNDNNTRLVGIFVFRVGEELLYAPAFFVNGNIKGTDLLYRHKSKRFVPLTPEWTEYLIGLNEFAEGQSNKRQERFNAREGLRIYKFMYPPKVASFTASRAIPKSTSSAEHAVWGHPPQEILDEMQKQAATDLRANILKDFIQTAGKPALLKLAAFATNHRKFSELVAERNLFDLSQYEFQVQVKSAAVVEAPPELTIFRDPMQNLNVKSASAADVKKGYVIRDTRKDAAVNEAIYDDTTHYLEGIGEPGVYKVFMANGGFSDMLVCWTSPDSIHSWSTPDKGYSSSFNAPSAPSDFNAERMTFVDLTSKHSVESYRQRLGSYTSKVMDCAGLEEKPTAGKFYRVLLMDRQSLSEPFWVKKIANDLGLWRIDVCTWNTNENQLTFFVNPEFDKHDQRNGILGKHARFVEVSGTLEEKDATGGERIKFWSDVPFGDNESIQQMMFKNGYVRTQISKFGLDNYKVEQGDFVRTYPKMAALGFLLRKCGLRQADAEGIMEKCASKSTRFIHQDGDMLLKKAYNTHMSSWPDMEPVFNDEFRTLEYPTIEQSVPLNRTEPDPLQTMHRIGDHDNVLQETGNADGAKLDEETLRHADPEQLHQLSQQRGLSTLFDHGVVGELSMTYDSSNLIDQYTGDLEVALDRLGRILFLFYWKPEDFIALYGADDQDRMENEFMSGFRTLGKITLELLRKSQALNQGSPAMN